MKIVHAVIRKLRPRARHPDGVRDEYHRKRQLYLAGIMTGNEAREVFTCLKSCNAGQGTYRHQISEALQLLLGRGIYYRLVSRVETTGKSSTLPPKSLLYLCRQKLGLQEYFQSSSKVVQSLSVRMTWAFDLFFRRKCKLKINDTVRGCESVAPKGGAV